jgi:hypothetical protein
MQGRFACRGVSPRRRAAYSHLHRKRKDRTMNAHPAAHAFPAITEADRSRLHDLARRRAHALRDEAIDAAWRRLAAALRRARQRLTRTPPTMVEA